MRPLTPIALLCTLALGCNDPAAQGFGPSEPPLPPPPTLDPIFYLVSAEAVTATPGGPDQVVFDVVLAVTHLGTGVEGASVYLWASSGTLSGTLLQSGSRGRVSVTWRVPVGNRVILSACAVPRLQNPCLPTVVLRRDT